MSRVSYIESGDLRIYDRDGREILRDGTIEFGKVKPDGKKRLDLTMTNEGRSPAENIQVSFSEENMGVTVELAPLSLEPGESKPLILSWKPSSLTLGEDFLTGTMTITYDFVRQQI